MNKNKKRKNESKENCRPNEVILYTRLYKLSSYVESLRSGADETVDCIEALAGRMGIIDQLKLQPDYIEWKKELNK